MVSHNQLLLFESNTYQSANVLLTRLKEACFFTIMRHNGGVLRMARNTLGKRAARKGLAGSTPVPSAL